VVQVAPVRTRGPPSNAPSSRARALVAQRPVDQDEIGRRALRRDLTRRGDADQQIAAGGEHLLGHQHGEGGADGAADHADLVATEVEQPHLGVVADPSLMPPCAALGAESTHDVAVGVEQAELRHRDGRRTLLTARLAQQALGCEGRRRLVMLVGKDGRKAVSAHARPPRQSA